MSDPSRQALVLVDVVPPSPEDPDIFSRLGGALAVARRAGIRVVHVWSAPTGGPPPATDPAITAQPGEPVLPNPGTGAWSGAGLGRTLVAGGIDSVVLAGRADSPAWWPTVEETAARPIPVTVLSDRRPAHDLRARQALSRPEGAPPARVLDVGAWAQEAAGSGPRAAVSRRRVVLLAALAALVALLAAGAAVIDHAAKSYYEFAPGSAPTVTASAACKVRGGSGSDLSLPDGSPCARLVVPAGRAHPVNGRLFMVDVLVGPASPVDYALKKLHLLHLFHAGSQLVPASAVLGNTPPSQLSCQDAQQMSGSTQDAAVAAIDRLGYRVKENDLGARVVQVSPGTAAEAAGVRCNDLVTAINGKAVHTADDLVNAIHALRPGQQARITVRRSTPGAGGGVASRTLTATLRGTPAQQASDGTPAVPADPARAFLGVATQTQLTYTFPFHVSIQVGNIGGPSAGLALTLGLLDVLSNGQLTGGKQVAATGTISPDGTVGDVGGVAQKTIAVRRAGAQVFLVPSAEYATARSEAGPAMQILPVASLGQALSDLRRLGGTPPPAAAPTTTTPTTTAPAIP